MVGILITGHGNFPIGALRAVLSAIEADEVPFLACLGKQTLGGSLFI